MHVHCTTYMQISPVPISSLVFWDQNHMLEVPLIGWLSLHINTLWTKLISPPPLHITSTPTTTLLQPCLEQWDLCSVTQAKCLRTVPINSHVIFILLSQSCSLSHWYCLSSYACHLLSLPRTTNWLWTFFFLASVISLLSSTIKKMFTMLENKVKTVQYIFSTWWWNVI